MSDRQSPDGTRALLAAMSALGLALGVTPAKADPPASSPWGSAASTDENKATPGKPAGAVGSTDEHPGSQSNQIKANQIKGNQIKSSQLKSNQLKSSQVKLNGYSGDDPNDPNPP